MDAYIISYFGKDKQTQLQRQAYHYRQLVALLEQPGIEDIHILAMEYDHKLITAPDNLLRIPHPRIKYHESELVPPGQARNKLLEVFYASSKDWGLFLDNDSIIDPRHDGRDIVNIIKRNMDQLNKEADLLTVVSPRNEPWTAFVEDNAEKGQHYTPLFARVYLKSSLFFLKNFVKNGQEPIYFDADLKELEDHEFALRLTSRGKVIRQIKTVILSEFGLNTSTLFEGHGTAEDELAARKANMEEHHELFLERYQDHGAERDAKGKPSFKKMKPMVVEKKLWITKDPDADPDNLNGDDDPRNSLFE